jgi:hypothetical protein
VFRFLEQIGLDQRRSGKDIIDHGPNGLAGAPIG